MFSDGEFKGRENPHGQPALSDHSRRIRTAYALLQMAETIGKRQALTRGILGNIVIPQLLLIMMAVGRCGMP